MMTATSGVGRSSGPARVWLLGVVAAVASIVANAAIRTVTVLLWDVSPEFRPFTWPQLTLFTVLGVVGATVVFAIVRRRARRPIHAFRRIAVAVLVLSLIPDLAILFTGAVPGASVPAVVSLMLMHVVTAAIAVGLLTSGGAAEAA